MPYPWKSGDVLTAADLDAEFQTLLGQIAAGARPALVSGTPDAALQAPFAIDTATGLVYVPISGAWTAVGALQTVAVTIPAPGPAQALTVGTPSATSLSLSWQPPATGATPFTYEVDYRVSGTTTWSVLGKTTNTSVVLNNLLPLTRYDLQVITTNSAGSSVSPTTQGTTGAVAPGAPTGLAVANITSTTVDLSWVAPVAGTQPISYQPQFQLSGASGWTNFGTPTLGTLVTITDLSASTAYSFQVVASNTAGSAISSVISTSTMSASAAPNAPTNVTVGGATLTSLNVYWTVPSVGTAPFSYVVLYRVTGTSTWSTSNPTTAAAITLSSLNSGTQYDIEVQASNAAGSSLSAVVQGTTTTASSPQGQPNSLVGSQIKPGSGINIGGPLSGICTAGTSLPLTGITVTDVAASTNPGTCTLSVVCNSGSAAMSLNGSALQGTGTTSISVPMTFSNLLSAVATLVFTAPATTTPTSDTVSVSVVDQQGNSGLIEIPIAINPAASPGPVTVTSDTTGTVAVQAAKVLGIVGINTRIDSQTGGYQTLSTVENCINYIWQDSGVRPIVRDAPAGSSDSTWWTQVATTTGARFISFIGETGPNFYQSPYESVAKSMLSNGTVFILEGCDEPDTAVATGNAVMTGTYPASLTTTTNGYGITTLTNTQANQEWLLTQAATFQATVWGDGQTANPPVPVINMSYGQVGFGSSYDPNSQHGYYGYNGSLTPVCTYANAHTYPTLGQSPNSGGAYNTGVIDMMNRAARLAAPDRPVAITKFGYTTSGNGPSSVPAATQAAYSMMALFDAYNLGNVLLCYYGLFDDLFGTYGWFDSTGTPRPIATAFHNLFALLADTNAQAATFNPGTLNVQFSTAPSGVAGNTGFQHLVMQKANGEFWVAMHNEQNLTDLNGNAVTVNPINVPVTLGTSAKTLTVYDPMAGTQPVQSGSGTKINVSVPAHPVLLQIIR